MHQFAHTHPLYKADNATVYDQLMIDTLGSQYASIIATFKRSNNDCVSINGFKAQSARAVYRYREVKVQIDFLLNGKWNGQTDITMHTFLAKHRASFHFLRQCGDHVMVDIPIERTGVGHMLDNIECNDKDVSAALSSIILDDNLNGIRNDF